MQVEHGRITVFFLATNECFTLANDPRYPSVKRQLIPINTKCSSPEGDCTVKKIIPRDDERGPYIYEVEFEATSLSRQVSEVELTPVNDLVFNSPLDALTELQVEGYGTFSKREGLLNSLATINKGSLGLRALLSSRIDLRPHQAFVAGTVLMDRMPRYLLADEVGLGKTIEAGIVIHDLLDRKPSAKILILCPGTLTQQWLCELYSKFSGRVFNLLELRLKEAEQGRISDKCIASFNDALMYSERLEQISWDMVVIDETHHILSSPNLYNLAQKISSTAFGCLLLSAIPAQHREEEYLKLLALLEPGRYDPNSEIEKLNFKQLTERQIEIGRKLSYIGRRVTDFLNGSETSERILSKLKELCALPVISHDNYAKSGVEALTNKTGDQFSDGAQKILHYIGDRYRINRRILRNRRSQLLEDEPELKIRREINRIEVIPNQFQINVNKSIRNIIQNIYNTQNVANSVLSSLSKQLFQASCDPETLLRFIHLGKSPQSQRSDLLEFDSHISYFNWEEYATSLWDTAKISSQSESFSDLQCAAQSWKGSPDASQRIETLLTFLKKRHRKNPNHKFLIFGGFYGLAEVLKFYLENELGSPKISRFLWNMEAQEKESEFIRFKRDSDCWIMISDETGGEGRNFQFVDEIVHYDLPWHVSKIEQRIGRLDRLGRKTSIVYSNVLYTSGEEEEGLLGCYESGFEVFKKSISGLEFSLNTIESRISEVSIKDGYDGLLSLSDEIKELVEIERAEDDVQGMLDAASLERTSAEEFRRVQSTLERDISIEMAFRDWVAFVGGAQAVRLINAGDFPEGIIEFRPDQLPKGFIPLTPNIKGNLPDRLGTFRRGIAQERPDLEFFSVGNSFFDAVCASLDQSPKGRTFAVECHDRNLATWRGFEFSYKIEPKKELLQNYPGLIKHLDRIFALKKCFIFVDESLSSAEEKSDFVKLLASLTEETKNRSWWNFTLNNTKVQLLARQYENSGWADLVKSAENKANRHARIVFKQKLEPVVVKERERINEQIRQASLSKSDDHMAEIAGLNSLLEVINSWNIELDTAGFLSINGGIIL